MLLQMHLGELGKTKKHLNRYRWCDIQGRTLEHWSVNTQNSEPGKRMYHHIWTGLQNADGTYTINILAVYIQNTFTGF